MSVAIELCCRAAHPGSIAAAWRLSSTVTLILTYYRGVLFSYDPAVSTESHGKSSEWVYFTCDRRVRTPNSNFIEPSLFGTIWLLKDRKVNGEAKKILNFFYRSLWKSTFFHEQMLKQYKNYKNPKNTKIIKIRTAPRFFWVFWVHYEKPSLVWRTCQQWGSMKFRIGNRTCCNFFPNILIWCCWCVLVTLLVPEFRATDASLPQLCLAFQTSPFLAST